MTEYLKIQESIAAAASRQDFDEAGRLAHIASQLKRLEAQTNQLLASVKPESQSPRLTEPVAKAFHPLESPAQGRMGRPGGLTIEMTTAGGVPVRICETNAAQTMVVLMEQILARFGMPGLEKLKNLRVSRGPLVSQDPEKDYRNSRRGTLYQHGRISGTNLFVLTHSSSAEKVEYVGKALRLLGLSDGAFKVRLE